MTADLWHFTCDHGYRGIGKRGVLRPHEHILLPALGPIVWLTSDPHPSRDDVGLSSVHLNCDRMAYRYRVRSIAAVPWTDHRHVVRSDVLADLERYGRPDTWWLAFEPTKAVLA